MTIKQLQYFLVVAQERQITAAAKRLYIAQPPLSYQLKQLEKEIGTQLFKRTPYGIELTDAGKQFLIYAEKIVNLSQAAQEKLKKEELGELGTIRMGVISSSGEIMPPKSFEKLIDFYPNINFELIEDNTFGIVEKMKNDLIDIAIVRTPFNMKGLQRIELNTDEMVVVYNENKFKFENDVLEINDLKGMPLILYRRFEAIFNASFSHQGISPFYAVKCDDARTAIAWADRGMGVALVPESIAQRYAQGRFIRINHKSWRSHLVLIWPKEKELRPVVKRVVELFERKE